MAAGPGLIGALLVGVTWARAAAFALGVPLVPVHHMEGHLFGPVLEDPGAVPPFVALLVSGGHTQLLWVPAWGRYFLMGETRDDAAGEAFDKVARILGLPYPGGPAIEAAAASGDPARYAFPRPLLRKGSARAKRGRARAGDGRPPGAGALRLFLFGAQDGGRAHGGRTRGRAGPARDPSRRRASSSRRVVPGAVVDVLAGKALAAVAATGCNRVLVGGGVAANRALKGRIGEGVAPDGRIFAASPRLSMDNGAMIARAGLFRLRSGDLGALTEATARAPIPGVLPWSPGSCDDTRGPIATATTHS